MILQTFGADVLGLDGELLAGGGAPPPPAAPDVMAVVGKILPRYAPGYVPPGSAALASGGKGTPAPSSSCDGGNCPAVTPAIAGATPGNTSVPVTTIPVSRLASTQAAPGVTGAQAITSPTAAGMPVWVWVVLAIVAAVLVFRS